MGLNWKEQRKHCKKPAEHTAGSQQNTPVFPESFPDVNFSCHSPWSILRTTGRTTFQHQLPNFLNDCTNIFQSIWRLQKNKTYTWRHKQQELWQKLLVSEQERDLTNCSNSPLSPILLHLVNANIHVNFSTIFLSYTKLHNISQMTLQLLLALVLNRNIWNSIFYLQLETMKEDPLYYEQDASSSFSMVNTYRFPSAFAMENPKS